MLADSIPPPHPIPFTYRPLLAPFFSNTMITLHTNRENCSLFLSDFAVGHAYLSPAFSGELFLDGLKASIIIRMLNSITIVVITVEYCCQRSSFCTCPCQFVRVAADWHEKLAANPAYHHWHCQITTNLAPNPLESSVAHYSNRQSSYTC